MTIDEACSELAAVKYEKTVLCNQLAQATKERDEWQKRAEETQREKSQYLRSALELVRKIERLETQLRTAQAGEMPAQVSDAMLKAFRLCVVGEEQNPLKAQIQAALDAHHSSNSSASPDLLIGSAQDFTNEGYAPERAKSSAWIPPGISGMCEGMGGPTDEYNSISRKCTWCYSPIKERRTLGNDSGSQYPGVEHTELKCSNPSCKFKAAEKVKP